MKRLIALIAFVLVVLAAFAQSGGTIRYNSDYIYEYADTSYLDGFTIGPYSHGVARMYQGNTERCPGLFFDATITDYATQYQALFVQPNDGHVTMDMGDGEAPYTPGGGPYYYDRNGVFNITMEGHISEVTHLDLAYINPQRTTRITRARVENFPALTSFQVVGSKLSCIYIDNCPNLEIIYLSSNELPGNVSFVHYASLKYFDVGYNVVTSVDIHDCPNLLAVGVMHNNLSSEEITKIIDDLPDRTSLPNGCLGIIPQNNGYPQTLTPSQSAAVAAKNWALSCD